MVFTDLKETTDLMTSEDYKERFIAEYVQTKIRYQRLHRVLVDYDAGKLRFAPNCRIAILREQKATMDRYLTMLEVRAEIEDIKLPEVEV